MTVTVESFLEVYPEFDQFTAQAIGFELEAVQYLYCPADIWTEADGSEVVRDRGIMLRLAHHLELRRMQMAASAAIGAAISQGETPKLLDLSQDDLNLTVYGKEFQRLRKRFVVTGFSF